MLVNGIRAFLPGFADRHPSDQGSDAVRNKTTESAIWPGRGRNNVCRAAAVVASMG